MKTTISVQRASLMTTAALLAGSALATPVLAQDNDGLYIAEQQGNRITVVASRLPSQVDEVPATVSVIDDEQIADELATDIKDLVRFEPGVSVPRSPARFGAALGATGRSGNSGFTIRGIGGNRTLILVDGVRVPDGFSFGPQDVGRGDYVDLGLVKQVEILRGPASALYGSDGLSGAVSFTLSEPADFLADGKSIGGLARAAYSSADNEFSETAIVAGGLGDISIMAAYTRRDYEELDNKGTVGGTGSSRTKPNPQDGHSNAALGRIVWEGAGGHKLRVTGEHTDTHLFTDVQSGLGSNGFGATVDLLQGTDTGERTRIAADWSYTNPSDDGLIDYAQVGVYWQKAKDRQFTREDRTPSVDRTRDNSFNNRVYGAAAELRSTFATGGLEHRLVVGGDISKTRQTGIRSGTAPTAPETFPVHPFPITDFTLGGLFIGDEISIVDGLVTLFPALRFDTFKIDPTNDPAYIGSNRGERSDSHVSPKLGAVVKLSDAVRLFANYATGFKAPEPSQVNQFFENLTSPFPYRTEPNPDLGPEQSESWEGGIRFAQGGLNLSATAFTADFQDFISRQDVGGAGVPGDPDVFQFVNLGGVEIWGLEGRAEYRHSSGFGGRFAIAYAKGDEELPAGGTVPLDTIDPLSVVAGLSYRDPSGDFGGEVIATHNKRKELERTTGACTATCYRPDAFTILDATAFFRVADMLTLRAGVFNVFDEKYAYWSDVIGLNSTSALTDAYTRPGRNFSASASLRF